MNANEIWRSIVSEAAEHAAAARMYASMVIRYRMPLQHVRAFHEYNANKGK